MLETIKKHLATLSTSNWPAFRTGLSSDVTYEDVSTGQRISGIEPFLANVQRWKSAFPDLRATISRGYVAGERVIVEVEWDGTHSGPLDGAWGSLPASHRHAKVKAALVYTVRNDLVVECRHYYDVLSLITQLGFPKTIPATQSERGAQARL